MFPGALIPILWYMHACNNYVSNNLPYSTYVLPIKKEEKKEKVVAKLVLMISYREYCARIKKLEDEINKFDFSNPLRSELIMERNRLRESYPLAK